MHTHARWPQVAGFFLSGAAALALVACGGGGGGAPEGDSPSGTSGAPASTSTAATGSSATGNTAPASAAGNPSASGTVATQPTASAEDCELFPATAVFNTRIDDSARFPAHASSATWIEWVGSSTRMQADWGTTENGAQTATYWGMPVNVVDGTAATTQWPALSFDFATSGVSMQAGWPHESDCAVADGNGFAISRGCSLLQTGQRRFPFPPEGRVANENGACNDPNSCGDHHVLVVEKGRSCRLWEAYNAYQLSGQWYAMSTAAWDLKSLALRPQGWTSGDAAGLPITPFLARQAEAASGEIRHALRMTLRDSVLARSFDWPARHAAGGDTPGGIPFGAVLRLKAGFVIPEGWTPQARALATAMKRYGVYVSDIGMDFYIQGEPSAGWDTRTFSQVKAIALGDMEFVDLGAITRDSRFSRDSMAASW